MKNRNDLERCQKTSLRLILGPKYENYEQALKYLHIDTLDQRRDKLCISFAKKCIKLNNMKSLFPILKRKHDMETRMNTKYVTNKAKSEKYKMSAVPQMQRLLNKEYQIQVRNFKECIKRSKNF